MESHFSQKLYLLYKSFEFRSLWNVNDKLAGYERTAIEAAHANLELQGVMQLNKALEEIERREDYFDLILIGIVTFTFDFQLF